MTAQRTHRQRSNGRQHLFQHGFTDAGVGRSLSGNLTADILAAKQVSEDAVAVRYRGLIAETRRVVDVLGNVT